MGSLGELLKEQKVRRRELPSLCRLLIALIVVLGSFTFPPVVGAVRVLSRASKRNELCDVDFRHVHLAHAKAGGPYYATDLKDLGGATVLLDGSASHTHATGDDVGKIVRFEWSWFETGNGEFFMESEKSMVRFPIGTTSITLKVMDNFGNCAVEETTVNVRPSAQPGAYCYYYDFGNEAPLSVPLPKSRLVPPLPQFALEVLDGRFVKSNGFFFANRSFAVRCSFSIHLRMEAYGSFDVWHAGPLKMYHNEQLVVRNDGYDVTNTTTPSLFYSVGQHHWDVHYFKARNSSGLLEMRFARGDLMTSKFVFHDVSRVLPVITALSKPSAFADEVITIYGSGLIEPVILFGDSNARVVHNLPGFVRVVVPEQEERRNVSVVVVTDAGSSNEFPFLYASSTFPCHAPKFRTTTLFGTDGNPFKLADVTVVKVGPDGRYYLGTQRNLVHALTVNSQLQVTKKCTKNVRGNSRRRWVMGIDFPKSGKLQMYFSSSTLFWSEGPNPLPFEQGWTNGKIQMIAIGGPNACFGQEVKDIVTGLPVSNIDHGPSFIEFLPTGELLISVASPTNAGVPARSMGNMADCLLSGAILKCPSTGPNVIKYSNLTNPSNARIIAGGCTPYATGFRNSMGMILHTNGFLYVTDNGANRNYGVQSTDCNGGWAREENEKDRLIRVEQGSCHGHPNLARGRTGKPNECMFRSPKCVGALLDNLMPSTNGILEYRSNLFDGALKGSLFLSRFSDVAGKKGSLTRVELDEHGSIKRNGVSPHFNDDSGLTIAEGPRGELIMGRVLKDTFLVLNPKCDNIPSSTYFIGVFPRFGPSEGGHRVLISGFAFGKTPIAMFGNRPCSLPQFVDNHSFFCTTPPGTANTQVLVTIFGDYGKSQKTSGSDYWYW